MRSLRTVGPAAAVFISGFIITAFVMKSRTEAEVTTLWSAVDAETSVVLVVSPTCQACNEPALVDAWETIVAHAGGQRQMTYRIGVATSPVAESGLEFLRRFGPFHEMSAGGGNEGLGSLRYVHRDLVGLGGVPQVILIHRKVGGHTADVSVEEKVVQRRVGLLSIVKWAEQLQAANGTSPTSAQGSDD